MIDVLEIIKYLNSNIACTFTLGIPSKLPSTPFCAVNIISDVTNEIQQKTRLEFRFIGDNYNELLGLDKSLFNVMTVNKVYGTVEIIKAVPQTIQTGYDDNNSKILIRDYIIYNSY